MHFHVDPKSDVDIDILHTARVGPVDSVEHCGVELHKLEGRASKN